MCSDGLADHPLLFGLKENDAGGGTNPGTDGKSKFVHVILQGI